MLGVPSPKLLPSYAAALLCLKLLKQLSIYNLYICCLLGKKWMGNSCFKLLNRNFDTAGGDSVALLVKKQSLYTGNICRS